MAVPSGQNITSKSLTITPPADRQSCMNTLEEALHILNEMYSGDEINVKSMHQQSHSYFSPKMKMCFFVTITDTVCAVLSILCEHEGDTCVVWL